MRPDLKRPFINQPPQSIAVTRDGHEAKIHARIFEDDTGMEVYLATVQRAPGRDTVLYIHVKNGKAATPGERDYDTNNDLFHQGVQLSEIAIEAREILKSIRSYLIYPKGSYDAETRIKNIIQHAERVVPKLEIVIEELRKME